MKKTKVVEEENDTFLIEIVASPDGITIKSEGQTIVDLASFQVLSVINIISGLIDEDIPGMVSTGEWNKENFQLKINAEVPKKPMIQQWEED